MYIVHRRVFVTCFKGEFVLNRGIANDFIKRQEIFSFGHIAKLIVNEGPGGVGVY
jgi:hypothetical protein